MQKPLLFSPLKMRGVTAPNRCVVSPMVQFRATDGLVNDFHLVHFGARALGGAGLIFTEMTCVSPEARITPGCCGLWNDEQAKAYKRIVDFVHGNSSARIGIGASHSNGIQMAAAPPPAGRSIRPFAASWPTSARKKARRAESR